MPDPLDASGQTLHAFLGQVIDQAPEVGSVGEAEQLTRGVLATLAQAVSGGQLADLVPGLPPELRGELDQASGQATALDLVGFLDRVGGRSSSTDLDVVEAQTRAVLSTLAAWAPQGETADTLAQLPAQLRDLFTPAAEQRP